ncbi:hypothetical protein [Legionella sp. 29fVS95]|uniref:hypothetical protein n=1 Tax=Legionella sp. 29fVS95 TaxID=3402813 RepID=UPI003AF606BC
MNHEDEALTISNPRLLSAVYFALLAVIATVIIDLFFYSIGLERLLPTFQAILLAVIVAACFGALFGERIVHCPQPYRRKTFLWGFLMVIVALPFYDLGFIYLLRGSYSHSFEGSTFSNLAVMYLFVLLYSFILAGLWLAIAAGFAAMYLRGHLVYDILHSKNQRQTTPVSLQQKAEAVKQTKNDKIITH